MYLTEIHTDERDNGHARLEFGNAQETKPLNFKFGNKARVHYFAPDAIFALHVYERNSYGTTKAEYYICRAIWPGEPGRIVPCVRPGAEVLFFTRGVYNCNLVFHWIRALKAADMDPADILPEKYIIAHFQVKSRRSIQIGDPFESLITNAKRRS